MINKNLKKLLVLIVSAIMILAACGSKEDSKSSETGKTTEKIKVMTTFYPMYEFTKNVAGDKAEVQLLIPSTQEPHDWEPTPKDIANVQTAALFIYNSEYMETFVDSIQQSVDTTKVNFVEASKGITLVKGIEEEEHDHAEGEDHDEHADHEEEEHHEEGEHHEEDHEGEEAHEHSHEMDPHVWLSPALAIKQVENITQSLIDVDPANKATYEENSKNYIAKLSELDNKYREALSKVSKKEIITQHAAFGYLASQYGLTQVPIAGLSPEQEPNAERLAELKKFAEQHDIKVIYFEELTSPKVAQTLANEIGAQTEVLNTLEGLSKEEQDKGLDYIKVMENNLEKLVQSQS